MENRDLTNLRQCLANSIVLMERAKLLDFNGHQSARVPGTDLMLINSRKSIRGAVTPRDIITIDLDGNLVEGDIEPPSEYPIHTEIYRRRPDVMSVAHTHPQWSTLFSISRIPLRPVVIQGAVLGTVEVFDQPNLINTPLLGAQLAEQLGDDAAILMKAHGAVVAGAGVRETFVLSYYLEENAYRQYMASQLGYAHSLSDDEISLMRESIWRKSIIDKVWDNHYAKL